jgi:sialate O-acetylesterase
MRTLITLFTLVSAAAAAQFAPVFTDNAVLQRDKPVEVWGTGRDGEKVEVEMLGHKVSGEVRDGKWSVSLPAMSATDSTTLTLRGDSVVELKDVAIGEVWLLTGQSNMEWRLNQCTPLTDALLTTANNPRIRQLKIPLRAYNGDPFIPFAWKPFDKASAPLFSAVGFFFADMLQQKLGVTVGLVNCSFGGTPIEAWMSADAIAAAGMQSTIDEDAKKRAQFPDAASYEKAWADYQTAKTAYEERKKAGVPEADLGPAPTEPYGYRSKSRPSGLRETMFSLITPYTARGVLWYQGENNAAKADDYAALLTGLIAELRRDWKEPALPVFIAQVSSPTKNWPDHEDPYARMRAAQTKVAKADPHSGFVVTLDRGEHQNVHPIDKQPIGERFARLALGRVYGNAGFAPQSPSARSAVLRDGKIEIAFDDLPGRLEIRDPLVPTLEVSEDGRAWQTPTKVVVSGDGRTLVITPPGPAKHVRYGWRNFCLLTLFTDEGLPVSPWNLESKES